ncbi:hypothetical protein E4T56_gene1355 [Termitomyces sp. T112]|nr:hypothetical protein E4T56_gene1355 [Termitomyces sp. T112]KAH0584768.1 hypothetical protein H2248_008050 [Termitomyces sp. 'cryptogamus']KNZ75802.1 hypothetical protein J132_01549 [Termitomyces sp. J132]
MSSSTRFSTLLALAASLSTVTAQSFSTFPPTPLANKHFSYPTGIPYQVDTDQGLIRGFQHGYNLCNSTTENQKSLCQTSFLNSVDDFCLWAPDPLNATVADQEGEMVAWCTRPGRGTRLIPAGALQGIQFMRTPDYVQVVGFIDQTQINIAPGDYGGELDPHGADLRGNPMGGIMFSNAWSNGNNNSYQQVIEWHNFMGGNAFCLKACDPAGPNAAKFCQHIYDRIGCAYNAPNNAQNGTFEACLGDNQDFPGIYTDAAGVVQTYTQPPEALGAISTMPYQPKVPASSSCTTYQSAQLYSLIATVSGNSPVATPTPTASGASGSPSAAGKSAASSSKTASGAAASATDNSASTIAASSIVGLVGVVFSAIFFS